MSCVSIRATSRMNASSSTNGRSGYEPSLTRTAELFASSADKESGRMGEKFEERYEDVLQNIEFSIVRVHRERPDLLDYDVDAALEALISRYGAEARGRTPREHALPGLRGEVYDAV